MIKSTISDINGTTHFILNGVDIEFDEKIEVIEKTPKLWNRILNEGYKEYVDITNKFGQAYRFHCIHARRVEDLKMAIKKDWVLKGTGYGSDTYSYTYARNKDCIFSKDILALAKRRNILKNSFLYKIIGNPFGTRTVVSKLYCKYCEDEVMGMINISFKKIIAYKTPPKGRKDLRILEFEFYVYRQSVRLKCQKCGTII